MAICKIGGLLLRHFSIVFNGTTATSEVVTIRCGRRWWGVALLDSLRGGTSPCRGPRERWVEQMSRLHGTAR